MSSTRHAANGIPFRQERFASSEAYRSSLNALLVAKRCALLRDDPELADMIWLVQEQSLADPFNVGNRSGSINQVARELLEIAQFDPQAAMLEDCAEFALAFQDTEQEAMARTVGEVVRALSEFALDPTRTGVNVCSAGVDFDWRATLVAYKSQIKERVRGSVAATSVLKGVIDALRFTKETGMPSLTMGVARMGKSAGAKTFCAASGGLARYVLTPEDDQMGSFYRAIAKALGVADALSKKDTEVRELVEKTLQTSRMMLVFDEAHNLFSSGRRLRREPGRVLWLRRLIDGGVPMAFVALPDFKKRIAHYVEQIGWDSAQITDLIARENVLPCELTASDIELLVAHHAADFSTPCKKLIATAAKAQRGAQYVGDVVKVAIHAAGKAGRSLPNATDVAAAIGARPVFQAPVPSHGPKSRSDRRGGQRPAPEDASPQRAASVAIPAM